MFKPFSLLFFIAVFAWIVSIFLTTDGSKRIERTCSPVELVGKVAVSGTALVADQFTGNVQLVMNQWVYGCRYVVWRSAYEEEYLQDLMQREAEKAAVEKDVPDAAKKTKAEGRPSAGSGGAEEKFHDNAQVQKL